MFVRLAALLALLVSVLGLGSTAHAAGSDWVKTEQTELRLVSAADAVGDSRTVTLGLHFRLKPGWKIYWRAPGDAGYPPSIDWTGSANLEKASLLWPAPHRFDVTGLTTMGYKGEVVLPISATLKKAGDAVSLRAAVEYLTCDDVCIPYTAKLQLDLPAGVAAPSAQAPMIGSFLARQPATAGVHIERASVRDVAKKDGKPGETVVEVSVSARGERPFVKPDIVAEHSAIAVSEPPRVGLEDGGHRALFTFTLAGDKLSAARLAGQKVVFTVLDEPLAVETEATPSLGAPPTQTSFGELAAMLLVALLGGLILNIMPCVLPVLSLKVIGAVSHGGRATAHVRTGFLASSAGIVASFLVLAFGAIALKSAGATVGWGIQFQQPVFLAFIIAVVLLFALNLAGLFEVALPSWLAGAAVAGEQHAARSELAGHFVSGAFAALLATPCSAPFVGTALSFALSRGSFETLSIFTAMGVGLAAPFLLVAAFPKLATRLPRPGAWMLWVKRLMALALFATAAWLFTVLGGAAGWHVVAAVAAILAVMVLAIGLRRRLGGVAVPVAVFAAVLAIAAPIVVQGPAPASAAVASGRWLPLDPARDIQAQIRERLAGGRIVIVDVTADWCVTCQVNKKLVLNAADVSARLDREGVLALRADWTRPSSQIADYLKANGRFGIPFNIVYGPGAPEGVALPELLSVDLVMAALDKAARK
ncbi:MAG: protein-disulfide reductase DsbD family protein [Reyranellaceae bacterium]